jgi:ABC-type sugar transport system permease subunit
MVGYVVYPLYSVVSSSFMDFPTLAGAGTWTGLANYQWLIDGGLFVPALGRSLYYTFANIILQTIIGFGIAVVLNAKLPGRNFARGAILFPFIVPGVVAALIWGYMFDDLTGVVNYVLLSLHIIKEPLGWLSGIKTAMNTVIVISIWKFMPFMIILFLARLQTIPTDMLEAARVDGANWLQIFRNMILPWMLPVVLVAVMLRMIWSFNEFDMPFLLTQGGPDEATLVLPVLIRQLLLDQLSPGRAAAVSTIMILILVLFGILYNIVYRRAEKVLDA